MICWKCKKEIKVEAVFRTTDCPLCGADLHSCKGCKFYSTGSHFDCRENISDAVTDKEKSNFCDFFSAKTDDASDFSTDDKVKKARDAASALFGGDDFNATPKSGDEAKNAFNALFGD